MALDGRMKLLLLQCTTVLLCAGVWALPAPLNLTVSSFNFRHTLNWTAAPGSPPNSTYHVYAKNTPRWKKVATSRTLWTEVRLREILDTYTLFVQSRWNRSLKSQKIRFTPWQDTAVITAPNVTLSGCGKCIQLNISMPKVQGPSGYRDITEIFNLEYDVSLRRKSALKAAAPIPIKNQTVIIPGLHPGTEYCVQVKPRYLEMQFLSSPWKCVFTSTVPSSQVWAVVGSVAGLVVLSLSALVMVFFALQYTGIICKLKEALPHPLSTGVWQRSLLGLERTVPEPVSLLPWTGRQQHSDWDQDEDEEDQGTQQVHPTEAQEEDHYMNRCVDLSSDYSSRSGNMTSSCQSAATDSDHPGSQDERIEGNKEEQAQSMNIKDWVEKEESRDCKDIDDWHKLENFESVDLFSVTIATPDVQSDQSLQHTPYESDLQSLQHTPYESGVHPLRHTPYESGVHPLQHTPYESGVHPLQHTPYESDLQTLQHTPYESGVHPLRHTPYESDLQSLQHTPYESGVQPLQHTPYESDLQTLQHTPYESDLQTLQHTPYESGVHPLQHTPYESDLQTLQHTPYESDLQTLQHTPYESGVHPLRHTPYESDLQTLQHTPYESDLQTFQHTPYESGVHPLRHTPYESDLQPLQHTPYESGVQPLRHTPYESDISSSRTETRQTQYAQ